MVTETDLSSAQMELKIILPRKYRTFAVTKKKQIDKIYKKWSQKEDPYYVDALTPGQDKRIMEGYEYRKGTITCAAVYVHVFRPGKGGSLRTSILPVKFPKEPSKQLFNLSTQYIGLDWDSIPAEELRFRKKMLRKYLGDGRYSIRRSSYKPDSYHVKIQMPKGYKKFPAQQIREFHFKTREDNWDDPMRLKFDRERDAKGVMFNVLWKKKIEVV